MVAPVPSSYEYSAVRLYGGHPSRGCTESIVHAGRVSLNVEFPKESEPSVLQTRELEAGALLDDDEADEDGDEDEDEGGQEVVKRDKECMYDIARLWTVGVGGQAAVSSTRVARQARNGAGAGAGREGARLEDGCEGRAVLQCRANTLGYACVKRRTARSGSGQADGQEGEQRGKEPRGEFHARHWHGWTRQWQMAHTHTHHAETETERGK